MSKKYLAKILARDLNGLNLISLYCHKSILKISDIKFLKENKIFLLSLQRNSIKTKKGFEFNLLFSNNGFITLSSEIIEVTLEDLKEINNDL